MSKRSTLFFFFPFLKNLTYLGMQTLSSIYFSFFGFLISCITVFLVQKQGHPVDFWHHVIAGTLSQAFLGSLLGTYFFDSLKKKMSRFELYTRVVTGSALISTLCWPLTGILVAVLQLANSGKPFSLFSQMTKLFFSYGGIIPTPFGIAVSSVIFLTGLLFRKLLNSFSNKNALSQNEVF